MTPELAAALERARQWDATATPEQRKAMMDVQRESWARAMEPCEHGDPDWETCSECRSERLEEPQLGTDDEA